MITTITIQVPAMRDVTRVMAADWGPEIRRWVGAAAAVMAAVYAAGLVTGARWWQLVAWAERQHLHGLARMGLPGGVPSIDIPLPTIYVQRQAPVTVPTITRSSECRRLRAQGLSPAAIGREMGISRTTVRRELAG